MNQIGEPPPPQSMNPLHQRQKREGEVFHLTGAFEMGDSFSREVCDVVR
jgi:hypothetical protein